MPVTLADRLLQVRYVAIITAIVVALAIVPPIWAVVRPPTVAFTTEVGTLFTDTGELTVDWYPSAEDLTEIVVRRWLDDGTAQELGRGAVYLADIETASVFTNNDFVMVCGPANGADSRRFLFGAISSRLPAPPRPAIDLISYFGPPAAGARFAHGLYLVVLTPGEIDLDAPLELLRTSGFDRWTARIFDEAIQLGRRQASGCVVA